MDPQSPQHDEQARRRAIRRTAWWVAAAAVLVYVLFLTGGYLGFAGGRS